MIKQHNFGGEKSEFIINQSERGIWGGGVEKRGLRKKSANRGWRRDKSGNP